MEGFSLPTQMGGLLSATTVEVSNTQIIVCHDKTFLYASKMASYPNLTFQKFLLANIMRVLPLIKNYFIAIFNNKRLSVFQTSLGDDQKIGLKFAYNNDKAHTSFFLRQIVDNMAELHLTYGNNNIEVHQFTVNGKMGNMHYAIDNPNKITFTQKQQLYGSKTVMALNKKILYTFPSFNAKAVVANSLTKLEQESALSYYKARPLAYVGISKVQEFYLVLSNLTIINVLKPSIRHTAIHPSYVIPFLDKICWMTDQEFKTNLIVTVFLDYLMLQDVSQGVTVILHIKQKGSSVIGVQYMNSQWFWTTSKTLIGLANNGRNFSFISTLRLSSPPSKIDYKQTEKTQTKSLGQIGMNQALPKSTQSVQSIKQVKYQQKKEHSSSIPKGSSSQKYKAKQQPKLQQKQQNLDQEKQQQRLQKKHEEQKQQQKYQNEHQEQSKKPQVLSGQFRPKKIIQKNQISISKTLQKSKQIDPLSNSNMPSPSNLDDDMQQKLVKTRYQSANQKTQQKNEDESPPTSTPQINTAQHNRLDTLTMPPQYKLQFIDRQNIQNPTNFAQKSEISKKEEVGDNSDKNQLKKQISKQQKSNKINKNQLEINNDQKQLQKTTEVEPRIDKQTFFNQVINLAYKELISNTNLFKFNKKQQGIKQQGVKKSRKKKKKAKIQVNKNNLQKQELEQGQAHSSQQQKAQKQKKESQSKQEIQSIKLQQKQEKSDKQSPQLKQNILFGPQVQKKSDFLNIFRQQQLYSIFEPSLSIANTNPIQPIFNKNIQTNSTNPNQLKIVVNQNVTPPKKVQFTSPIFSSSNQQPAYLDYTKQHLTFPFAQAPQPPKNMFEKVEDAPQSSNQVHRNEIRQLFQTTTTKLVKVLQQMSQSNDTQRLLKERVIQQIQNKVIYSMKNSLAGPLTTQIQSYFNQVLRQVGKAQQDSIQFYRQVNLHKHRNIQAQVINQDKILKQIKDIDGLLRILIDAAGSANQNCFQGLMQKWKEQTQGAFQTLKLLLESQEQQKKEEEERKKRYEETKNNLEAIKKMLVERADRQEQKRQKKLQRKEQKIKEQKLKASKKQKLQTKASILRKAAQT